MIRRKILKSIVQNKRLKPEERIAVRVGYMGSAFLISAQWTIEPVLYVIGFIFVMVQTTYRQQWNLVALNLNGLIAWITHLLF